MEDRFFEAAADRLVLTFLQVKRRERRQSGSLWQGEHGVLMYLCSVPDGVRPGKIAKDLHIGSGGVANLLNGLEEKGWIERSMSPTDRRSVIVRLSEAGRAKVEQQKREGRQRIARMLAQLGREDTEELQRILEKVLSLGKEETPTC